MGKKDKGKKSAEKKARVAEKTARKSSKKEQKAKKKSGKGGLEDEEDDVDLDAVLEEYTRQQALFLKVTETLLAQPPPVRANATLTPSPSNTTELYLFGGETFNGTIAHFFSDLFVYNTATTTWRHITSPNSPLPRSGHWVTATQNSGGSLWLFGGEFSSPKQGTFYHYNDFWRFDCNSKEWNRIETKKGPPARSGHRMVGWKNYIILMSGFQDTSANTKYLSDLWVFDTVLYTWTQISLPAHAQRPDARSSFSLLPHEQGAVIYGGYSRVKASGSAPSAGRKGAKFTGSVLKPVIHQDTWLLRMDADLSKVRWERRKKPVNSPNPPRVGVTMAYHKGRGILFGGVKDEEESEEGLESTFFDELFAWSIDRNRFFPLVLRKPRVQKKVLSERAGGGRRDRAKEDEEELLRNLAALEAAARGENVEDAKPKEKEEEKEEEEKVPQQELSLNLPHARFNTAMAVQDDVLYIYGGTFEKGDREYTFDEMYSIDLGKLDGVRTIFSRADETQWEISESEDEDDEDDEEEEDEDEDAEDEEKDDGKPDEAEIEERRKEKALRKQKAEEIDTPATPVYEGPDEAEAALDTTPHPRPFESLREFYARTSTAWQDLLIARQNEVVDRQKATKTIKELRKEAFELAEDKWWACREEIRALEDEQEEAGIGEVVSLGDTAAGGGAGGAGRRR